MIKVTATIDSANVTKFFETVGEALKWLRSMGEHVAKWCVYGNNGQPYYSC